VRSGRFVIRRPPPGARAGCLRAQTRRRDCWAVRRWRTSMLRA
jgi:hypothetical protein